MSILAYQSPVFKPAMRIVSGITNAFPAAVTTTFSHGYLTGIIVRLVIPLGYGMVQANQLSGTIVVTGATTFTINIDTRYFSTFVTPDSAPENLQSSQCVPFAEDNATLQNAYQNVLPY